MRSAGTENAEPRANPAVNCGIARGRRRTKRFSNPEPLDLDDQIPFAAKLRPVSLVARSWTLRAVGLLLVSQTLVFGFGCAGKAQRNAGDGGEGDDDSGGTAGSSNGGTAGTAPTGGIGATTGGSWRAGRRAPQRAQFPAPALATVQHEPLAKR